MSANEGKLFNNSLKNDPILVSRKNPELRLLTLK